jgi:microcystin-dependent protein
MTFKTRLAAALISGAIALTATPSASAGPDEYIGEIITVGFNFCPRGTLEADGRLMAIAENTALFSLYGTMYGGDGRTTFALPDMRGRTAIGAGQGPTLRNRRIGQTGGIEQSGAGSKVPVPAVVTDENLPGDLTHGNNMPPYLVVKQCVVLLGRFPARN